MEISLETGMDRQLTESAAFFESQSLETRHFLFNQAGQIWKAVQKGALYYKFQLPAEVNLSSSKDHTPGHRIPGFKRNQHVLNLSAFTRQSRESSTASFTKRLEQMERENNPVLRDSARLVRYATARHIVFNELEVGMPANQPDQFYKPAWIFIQQGKLLAPSIDEGRKILHKMEKYLHALRQACAIDRCIQADPAFQERFYGMGEQLTHQGRELANVMVIDLIKEIRARSNRNELNRGFTLSVPFFDDLELALRMHDFEVIPRGRIVFEPAFVVEAARKQQAVIAQDQDLSPNTQKYLLDNLRMIEKSFGYNQQYHPLGMLFFSKSLDETASHIEHILPGNKGSRKKT